MKKTYPIVFLFILLPFFQSCKKTFEKEKSTYSILKNWVHLNGGIYKNETLVFKSQDGTIKYGLLDWGAATMYNNNGTDYTDVPFSFRKSLQVTDLSTVLTFSLVIRTINNQIEGAIKVTQLKASLKGSDRIMVGTIENYFKIDGNWINTWFRENITGRWMKRKYQILNTGPKISVNSISNISPKSTNVSCYSFSTPSYEIQCSPTNPGNPTSYDVSCVWVNVGVGVFVFCYEDSGGREVVGEWPPSSGTGTNASQQQNQGIPCPGDVLKNPKIARSNPSNTNGGRFGPTRRNTDGTPKMHKGLDIYALPGTPIYAAFSGIVTRSITNYPTDYWGGPTSFGNLVEIESTLPNGQVIRMLYAHLNSSPLSFGTSVLQGQEIGLSGRTGNAQKGYSPHVHVQVTENAEKKNPENYLATKYDAAGSPVGRPCY